MSQGSISFRPLSVEYQLLLKIDAYFLRQIHNSMLGIEAKIENYIDFTIF